MDEQENDRNSEMKERRLILVENGTGSIRKIERGSARGCETVRKRENAKVGEFRERKDDRKKTKE